ncbi:hypothetical protein C0991_002441 [Blastosporella zonata]|nr:hypothetical protein C0991_002441 [Blastosporella zonata]
MSIDNTHTLKSETETFFPPSIHCMAQSTTECLTYVSAPEAGSSTPSLEEVPREYFVQSLRALAPRYWDRPETSDCTIRTFNPSHAEIQSEANEFYAVVPIPQLPGGTLHPAIVGPFPTQTHTTISSLYDSSGSSGRRASEPIYNLLPRLRLQVCISPVEPPSSAVSYQRSQLHVDYLSAHSSYIRALLTGANPLDLVHTTTDTYNGPQADHRYSVPANRMPHLLPGPSNRPTLYLPVPDPSSFHLIIHWMYFGDTTYMEQCLSQKLVHWEGIARNAEYLGVSSELRMFLKLWYYQDSCAAEDSDTAYSESDGDDEMDEYESSTASENDSDLESDNEKDPPRGRPRIRRPLSYQEPGTKPWYN